jgi:outer membrane protein assembly factor BamD
MLASASAQATHEDANSDLPTPPADTQNRPIHTHQATAAELNDPEYLLAQQQEAAGNNGAAITAYTRFLRHHPASSLAAEAQYHIAKLYEKEGNLRKEFDAYQVLLVRYPDTAHFEEAVSSQIVIANKYLAGYTIKVLGFGVVTSIEDAEKMYSQILKSAPYSKNAPVAQFNLALTYERQGMAKEAAAAYQEVMDKYPNAPIAIDAMYQIGYVYMMQGIKGRSQDLSSLQLAKDTFEDFILEYPNSEKVPQAQDNLALIQAHESGDILAIGKFYEHSKSFKAAVIYYNDVIRRQPKSPQAVAAKDRIDLIKNKYGEDTLHTGPTKAETGGDLAMRRKLQTQVETPALSNYAGPPKADIAPAELPVAQPKLRTDIRDVQPIPSTEPALPTH